MNLTSWNDFGLSPPILDTIKELNFTSLTPVQASCIPLFLNKRKDVAVEAVTGSGKTLSFLIPMFEVLLKKAPFRKHDVAAIVISPTRELAAQTFDIASVFLKHMPQFTCTLLIGGSDVNKDIRRILEDGVNIIIATPGRLADLFTKNSTLRLAAYVKTLEMLILDEADRLLHMGFERTLNTILGYLPKQRQTGLFSATQTQEMEDLIRAGLRNPVCISVKEKTDLDESQRTPITLSNFYTVCDADKKFSQLIMFLETNKTSKCMVFFSTCASVNYFALLMKEFLKDVPVISIHGKMRKKRHEIFSNFKNYEKGVLVCTDVMARGVDIPDVQWVIQFDPPSSASSFVHRCGRTARIGKSGSALLMLLPNEESFVHFLNVNQKVELKEMVLPDASDLTTLVKKKALKNRDIFEKGTRAFVSFIRFYTKHECSLIFRLKELELGKLASGFALLRLPKMPELKKKAVKDFIPMEADYEKIPFIDKTRERLRQENILKFKENPELRKPMSEKREKQLQVKKLESRKQLLRKKRKRKAMRDTPEDLEEFARDARLLKKFKKGKMTKEEFDAEFAPEVQDDFDDA